MDPETYFRATFDGVDKLLVIIDDDEGCETNELYLPDQSVEKIAAFLEEWFVPAIARRLAETFRETFKSTLN